MNVHIAGTNLILHPAIAEAFAHPTIRSLITQTLAEDFRTFIVPDPEGLANYTMDTLKKAGVDYTGAAQFLALEVYPKWQGQNIRNLYHDYNWRVERAGSATLAAPWLQGNTHVDIGGGPGTFALEIMKHKSSDSWVTTIADIADYRNPTAKTHGHIRFYGLNPSEPPPFPDKAFDTGSLLYVLHHVERDHANFLRDWARCIRCTLLIFEDVKVDTRQGIPTGTYRPARALESDFLRLSLEEQQLYMAGIDYVCNHIASQALTMPVPAKYYEFKELTQFLEEVFPKAQVTAYYHGMYDTKCYPNPEAMYVVEFPS